MQTILDAPMVAQAPAVVLRAGPFAADEIPGLGGRLSAYRPLAVADADGGQTGPILTPANPLGAVQDGVTAILLPAVALRTCLIGVVLDPGEILINGPLNPGLDVLQQMRLIVLDRQRVVTAAGHDLGG